MTFRESPNNVLIIFFLKKETGFPKKPGLHSNHLEESSGTYRAIRLDDRLVALVQLVPQLVGAHDPLMLANVKHLFLLGYLVVVTDGL